MPELQMELKGLKLDFEADITKSYIEDEQEDGERIIEGFVTTNDLDVSGDIITEEAIDKAVPLFLERPIVLFNHLVNIPIGTLLDVKKKKTEEGSIGIWIKALISKTESGFWQKIKENILNKFSFRLLIPENSIVTEWDNTLKRMTRKILSFLPIETSLVSVPDNAKARSISWYIQKALDLNIEEKEKTKGGFSMDELAKLKEEMSVEFTKQIETITSQFAADKETLTKQLSDVESKLSTMEQVEKQKAEDTKKAQDESRHAEAQIEIKKNLGALQDILAMAEEAKGVVNGTGDGDAVDLLAKIVDALNSVIAVYPEMYPSPAKSMNAVEPVVETVKSFDISALNETIQKSIQAAVTKGLGEMKSSLLVQDEPKPAQNAIEKVKSLTAEIKDPRERLRTKLQLLTNAGT